MPRIVRVMSSEGVYHIIVHGNENREIFRDYEDCVEFLHIISRNKERYGFYIYAYCLMSNHVHLLIGCNGCNISQVMKSINISFVRYFNRKYQRCGHLFQDRFKSELIDTGVDAIEVAGYIHLNPVRAEIVEIDNITQYPWSGHNQFVSNQNSSHLPVDAEFILGIFSNDLQAARRQYLSYLTRSDAEDLPEEKGKPTTIQVKQPNFNNDRYENFEIEKLLEMLAADYNTGVTDIKAGRIPSGIRNEMIITARLKSQLTLKSIGEIFGGLSESMVSKILKNK